MQNYVYIQYFVGQLLILFLGYNFLRTAIIGYITALLSLAALLPLLVRFVPGYVYYIIFFILLISLIYFIYKKNYLNIYSNIKNSKNELFIFILINIFFLLLFNQFHFKNFVYEAHDVVYWGPSIELYYSDYIGNLKNFTYFPSELSAHPLYPTSILSIASIFIKDLNLISILEIRYLLICNFLTFGCFLFYKCHEGRNYYYYSISFFIFILLIYSFENFIAYSLIYSGIFSILVFLIFLTNFENLNQNNIKFNSYLSLILVITKPGIFFIFSIFPIYYFLKYKVIRRDIFFYILSFVIFLNILTWIIVEKPIANSSLTIFNPLELKDYFQTLLLAGWIQLGSVFQNFETLAVAEFIINFDKSNTSFENIFKAYKLQKSKVNYDIFKFLIVFIYFFLLPLILIFKNLKINHIFTYFIFFSFLILIFIRNENMFGNKSVSQVAHIIYVLPIFLISIFVKTLSKKYFKTNLFIFFSIIIIFSNFQINFGKKINLERMYSSGESTSYQEFMKYKNRYKIEKDFLVNLNADTVHDLKKIEIHSMMYGKRIREKEYDKFDLKLRPTIINWSLTRYHDFFWNNKIIKKNIH